MKITRISKKGRGATGRKREPINNKEERRVLSQPIKNERLEKQRPKGGIMFNAGDLAARCGTYFHRLVVSSMGGSMV
jgi:hypothetical protein